jgi:ubiquinone/menaquinone biosynthesis C-methylase UbiE
MNYLNPRGFTVIGCDIAPNRSDVIECPAWSMPFADKQFDVTYSTDVLEHFPTDLVDIAIAEILRVTKHKSIHVVATFDHVRNGEVLHKSVYPIEWWKEKFAKLNTQGIELVIKDREPFLKEMGSNAV